MLTERAKERDGAWDRVVRTSRLPGVDPARLWAGVTAMSGVNAELMPIMRMRLPKGLRDHDPSLRSMPTGVTLGRCWVLLGGVLPIDFDDLKVVEVQEGQRFLERSKTLSAGVWQHERTMGSTDDGGAWITDRLSYRLRPHTRPLRRPFHAAMGALFTHRHRRLARRYTSVTAGHGPSA